MAVWIGKDSRAVARKAAENVCVRVAHRPSLVLGLAAGNTPRALHAELVQRHGAGTLDLSHVTTFTLDEYLGLEPEHGASFASFVRTTLLDPVGLDPARAHGLDGACADAAAECARYEAALRAAGGVDLQILGLGVNGHVAFNEPGSEPDSRTRVVQLTGHTRLVNAPAFGSPRMVPLRALTMGLGTIAEARELLLIATGESKAKAVAAMLHGPVDVTCPASFLRDHPGLTVLLDPAAASLLEVPVPAA